MLLAARSSLAQTDITWSGAANTTFATAGNWVGGVAPANDLITNIGLFSGTVATNPPVVTANRGIGGLQFNTPAGGWTLGSGGILTLGSSGISTDGQTSGTDTIAAKLAFPASAQNTSIIAGSGGTLSLNGVISGGAGGTVTIGGSSDQGIVIFDAVNTYTASTTLAYGTVDLMSTQPFGAANSAVAINDGVTIENTSSGNKALVAYATTVNGSFTYAETDNFNVNFNGGTIALNASPTITVSGADTLTGNLILTGVVSDGANGPASIAANVSDTGAILQLNGLNTFSGGLNLNAGKVETSAAGTQTSGGFGTGTVTLNGGAVSTTLLLNGANATIYNPITVNTSTADQLLEGNNNQTFNSNILLNGAVYVQENTNADTLTFAGNINGNGKIILTTGNALRFISLNGSNSYTGGTTVNGGTLIAGSTTAFGAPTGASLSFTAADTGTVQLNGNSTTIVGLTAGAGAGTNTVENASATTPATLNVNVPVSSSFAGVLADGGAQPLSLTLGGAGALTLAGANTYTGATSVNTGALALAAGGSLGGTAVTVASGATLQIAGATSGASSYTIGTGSSGSVTLDGTLKFVDSNSIATTLNVNSGASNTGLTLGSGTLDFNAPTSGAVDTIADQGQLSLAGATTINLAGATLSPGTYPLITFPGGLAPSSSGAFQFSNGSTVETIVNGPVTTTYTLTPNGTNTAENLVVTANAAFPAAAYWGGARGWLLEHAHGGKCNELADRRLRWNGHGRPSRLDDGRVPHRQQRDAKRQHDARWRLHHQQPDVHRLGHGQLDWLDGRPRRQFGQYADDHRRGIQRRRGRPRDRSGHRVAKWRGPRHDQRQPGAGRSAELEQQQFQPADGLWQCE